MRTSFSLLCGLTTLAACGGPPVLTTCDPSQVCGFINPADLAPLGEGLVVSQMHGLEAPGELVHFVPGQPPRLLTPLVEPGAWSAGCEAPTALALEWTEASGWRPLPGTEGAYPNGVAVSPDGHQVYVSYSIGHTLAVYDRASGAKQGEVAIQGPDNLTWDGDHLLVTSSSAASLDRLGCSDVIEAVIQGKAQACAYPGSVYQVDARLAQPPTLLTSLPLEPSVALRWNGKVWVGTWAGDRLVRW